MRNQKSVFVGDDEFQCTEFFDADSGTNQSNIEVTINNKLIGVIPNLSIPNIEDEEENIKFDEEVTEWVTDNYFN